jgi:plastocyanin
MEREEGHHRARRRAFTGVALMVLVGITLVSAGVALAFRGNPGATIGATTSMAPAGSTVAVTGSAVSAPEPAAKSAPAKSAAPEAAALPPRSKPTVAPSAKAPSKPAAQHFDIAIGAKGYEPERIVAKAGAPISLTVGRGQGCAAGFELPSLGLHGDNSAGPATLSLGTLKAGTYTYTCSMGMVTGKLVVR